ncbi:transcription factor bHLH153-like [Phoenix dactylifera]|uniref:Transcription factor bHLH153-like n=1 Tax=Phoenix dactylifera TaxID=42345 RepID=A0A8B7CKS3_PHODC|nr:transcription factor bHLH153-like [Phoenix dactylifera]XP_026663597.2 transcription factor bHLH153-like [Phoenix dactylifera]XP_038989626.1 transcription factor bHLH153-like [Phoenix dactylifera]
MMMMMMAEVTDQKRRSHDSCLLSNIAGAGGGHSHNSSITTTTTTTTCSGLTAKRLKTGGGGGGGGGGTITTKEKKDKIGERVAKLQQLVSPFGKSDTASVLQETTGYIKFLHDQLQVLSAPYLRARTPTGKTEEAQYCSLRSRGLCLMPISSTLRIAQSNGADLWAPVSSNKQP